MSNQSSYTFQSSSTVSYSSNSGTQAQHTYSDPSGTTVTTASKPRGGETTYERREYPSDHGIAGNVGSAGRIEDVTDRETSQGERDVDVEVEEAEERR